MASGGRSSPTPIRNRNHSWLPRAEVTLRAPLWPAGEPRSLILKRPQHQVQLVVNHEQVLGRVRFKLLNQSGHCQPAQVHKRLRLGQDHFAPRYAAGCGGGPASPVLDHNALLLGDAVNGHEPRVMRRPQILRAGIAQPHHQKRAAPCDSPA